MPRHPVPKLVAAIALAISLAPGMAVAQSFALTEGAPQAVLADVAKGGTVDRVRSWSGDIDGQGGADLVVQVAYWTGGNSVQLAHFLYTGSPLRRTGTLPIGQNGIESVRRVGAQIEVTKLVYRAGDRRCCPTGRETVRFAP